VPAIPGLGVISAVNPTPLDTPDDFPQIMGVGPYKFEPYDQFSRSPHKRILTPDTHKRAAKIPFLPTAEP